MLKGASTRQGCAGRFDRRRQKRRSLNPTTLLLSHHRQRAALADHLRCNLTQVRGSHLLLLPSKAALQCQLACTGHVSRAVLVDFDALIAANPAERLFGPNHASGWARIHLVLALVYQKHQFEWGMAGGGRKGEVCGD